MSRLTLQPVPQSSTITIQHRDLEGVFTYHIPEAIGSTDGAAWDSRHPGMLHPVWQTTPEGGWSYSFHKPDLLAYTVCVRPPGEDYVDVEIRLRNLGEEDWSDSLAFSCFSPRQVPAIADFDGSRTFLLLREHWKPITQVKRVDSSRPTIQLWYTGADRPKLRFVESFRATPSVFPEGILAVRSSNGRHVIAVTTDRPSFLFSNLEFSCIHSCPTFGALRSGEEAAATHRVYLCARATLEQLREKVHHFVYAS